MPQRSRHIIYSLLLFSFMLWSMQACIDEDSTSPCEVESPDSRAGDIEVCLNVTIYPPDAVMPTDTRATRSDEVETTEAPDCHPFYTELIDAGTAAENQIRSVTVFMVDLDEKDREQLTYDHIRAGSVYVQTTTLPSSGTTGYVVTINLKTTTGRKHVYVGANLSDDQIECFRKDNRPVEYTHYTDANLKEIMSHFMTISDDQFTYTGSLISMFAKAAPEKIMTDATAADSIFVVSASTGNDLLTIAVEKLQLERTVAKVLLTCLPYYNSKNKEETQDDGYENCIAIQDLNETARQLDPTNTLTEEQLKAKYRGWVQQGEVYYILNIAARTQRLLHDSVATLGNYVTQLRNYNFVAADDDVYTRRYLSYTAEMLKRSTDDSIPFFAGALRRQAVTCETRDEALTTHEGVYTLPNLFRFRKSDKAGEEAEWYSTPDPFQLDSIAKKVATYMVVAVRYVPRTLHCLDKEGKDVEVTFSTMAKALDSLPAIQAEKLPAGTYWAKFNSNGEETVGIDYYTYAAMKKLVAAGTYDDLWSLARFRCYEGGFGYYITYIDPMQNEESALSYDYDVKYNGVARQDRVFGLERNHYYVLRTDRITVPGSSALGGTMRLNAVLLDWKDRGENTEVEVLPGTSQ
jgi:hypothetical protein